MTTKAVSYKDICLLKQHYYCANTGTSRQICVEWVNLDENVPKASTLQDEHMSTMHSDQPCNKSTMVYITVLPWVSAVGGRRIVQF